MIAYHADPAVRDAVMARFDVAVAEDRFGPLVETQDGFDPSRTVASVIAGEDDPALLADATGFPIGLAALLATLGEMAPRDDAAVFIKAWLSAPAAGQDLSLAPARLVHDRLKAVTTASASRLSPEAARLAETLLSLHAQESRGEPASPQAWREVRRSATRLLQDEAVEAQATLKFLETLSWPTSRAPELVGDLFWAEALQRQLDLAVERGLPAAQPGDDTLMERIVEGLVAQGQTRSEAMDGWLQAAEIQRPDFIARGRGLEALMAEITPKLVAEYAEQGVSVLSR